MCTITFNICVSFEDILVLFSLQRLNFLFDHCAYLHGLALLMAFLINALMCIKKEVRLINHDRLPILMLLYIMLACLMLLAYLMLLAALYNAVFLYNAYFFPFIFGNAFRFHALSWFIDTLFVYFKYYFTSCIVVLICWFSKFYVYTIF